MAEIKYEVVQRVAVLSQRPRGWERQLNLISWNDGEPKYDIRDWSPDGTRMGAPEPTVLHCRSCMYQSGRSVENCRGRRHV